MVIQLVRIEKKFSIIEYLIVESSDLSHHFVALRKLKK